MWSRRPAEVRGVEDRVEVTGCCVGYAKRFSSVLEEEVTHTDLR